MRKVYKIEVDCANCANKMELAAGKIAGVAFVSVNYMTQKMTLEYAPEANIQAVQQAVEKACRKIDSDFSVSW